MTEIKILIEGYAKEENNAEFASSTTTFGQMGKNKKQIDEVY